MNKKLNNIKTDYQYIMIITKSSPELFNDGIGEELYELAKQGIKNLEELKKEIKKEKEKKNESR